MIRSEASRLHLDLDRIVFVGHSAGGHLALWAAARDRLPQTSPLWRSDPVLPDAVVGVAAPGNIEPLRAVSDGFCGEGVFDAVVGLPTDTRPNVFPDTSPSRLLPFGLPIRLIDGSDDEVIPPPLMVMFENEAKAAGDDVTLELVPDADHIDVITSGEAGWAAVRRNRDVGGEIQPLVITSVQASIDRLRVRIMPRRGRCGSRCGMPPG